MKRRKLKKGLAILLTAAMVVGLMPGVGTMQVSATESENSETSAEGYDANGFCTDYADDSSCTTHTDCNGYQPAPGTTGKYEVDGDSGTLDVVYEISNAGQLYWFADKVNNDNGNYGSANAVLTAHITVNEGVLDASGNLVSDTSGFREWTPIGGYNGKMVQYTGTFDGDNHKISGLYYKYTSTENITSAGLFGCVFVGGKVSNVGVVDSYFELNFNGKIYGYISGVCGFNRGTIENCYNKGNVVGKYETEAVLETTKGEWMLWQH